MLINVVIFFVLLTTIFYLVTLLISFISITKNKVRSFERGFESIGKIQNSFSIHFFIIILIFIIFDLEVVIFLGILISDISSLVRFILLLTFVFGGFYIE